MAEASAFLNSAYTVKLETLDSLKNYWEHSDCCLHWPSLFSTPFWMKVWSSYFGCGQMLHIVSVYKGETLIGLAPMILSDDTVSLIGSPEVCDYLDFIIAPGLSLEFFETLIKYLNSIRVKRMTLICLREDSIAISELVPLARRKGFQVSLAADDVTYEMELPPSWEQFLELLNKKQRHEVRRKIRRLEESGTIMLRVIESPVTACESFPDFLELFRLSRVDKAAFMTDAKADFFHKIAVAAAEEQMLRLCFLDFEGRPVSAALCFNYDSTVFLYNSGYDSRFSNLNVGLVCKLFSIRDSIERGSLSYDFLKGNEIYKQRLGGHPVRLYRCEIDIDITK